VDVMREQERCGEDEWDGKREIAIGGIAAAPQRRRIMAVGIMQGVYVRWCHAR
jgi:hypothetical protein